MATGCCRLPLPLGTAQVEPAVAAHVQVIPVKADGKVSLMTLVAIAFGPLLAMVRV
jgi:hypothetical protein